MQLAATTELCSHVVLGCCLPVFSNSSVLPRCYSYMNWQCCQRQSCQCTADHFFPCEEEVNLMDLVAQNKNAGFIPTKLYILYWEHWNHVKESSSSHEKKMKSEEGASFHCRMMRSTSKCNGYSQGSGGTVLKYHLSPAVTETSMIKRRLANPSWLWAHMDSQ